MNKLKHWKLVNFCEIDKFAVQSYCAIHNIDASLNLGDVSKVNAKTIDDFKLMTWGFPCTDISVGGYQKGFIDKDGNQTSSGMYYEGIRILREKKPVVSIIENVKNLVSNKFSREFETVLSDLEDAGYNNYWTILNACDFGIPQNRERVFIVSIRKDVDNGNFKFPTGHKLEKYWIDFIDTKTDKPYYFTSKQYKEFVCEPSGDRIKRLGYMIGNNGRIKRHQSNTVYDPNGLCPTLYAGQYKDPFRFMYENKIRRMSAKETFLMMGFSEEDYETARKAGVSNGQLYKQSGNSIVVDVPYHIFKELYIALPHIFDDLTVGSFFSGIGAFEKALDRLYTDINSEH